MLLRDKRFALSLIAALMLGACSSSPKTIASASTNQQITSQEIAHIEALLDQGETRSAKRLITKGLKRDPTEPSLHVLLQGIEGDAKADLGPASFGYVTRSGDTMIELAERFLGNRLKSYQLAKYNGIDVPSALQAGTELRIPGQARQVEASTRQYQPRRTDPSPPPARKRAEVSEPVKAEKAKPEHKVGDPAAAGRARSAGLVALNQGEVARALTLLRRAAALEPSNAAIAADLRRAELIAATVRARK
ncbi:LysM peptidoglycan-binding domain-containing protein [Altererythrobacter aurantiacus]|uniref:LysM peptidoglycan-binding domain-containing protein n=1 Tax=Parapontixanthobacter aurantiacus TaxID=1463599 RepID=A0A844ZDP3_9SPHN|nr:LysM peptidoglycan-binding domain-containing protein [Parapontixanthobacter aurantiacus]MXO85995.1 LysM peptidoglycan-binding domain-containing protein [Parapontixanthobacter aurantiacus]